MGKMKAVLPLPTPQTKQPTNNPLVINMYNDEDEVVATFEKFTVRWGLLKKALSLAENLKGDDISDEDFDSISNYVCMVFNEQFTRQELEDGADISEVMAVFKDIVKRARALGNG